MADLNTGLTQEQMSERGRKAGLKSVEKRREKKRMREWAEIIGEKRISINNADGTEEVVPYDCAVVASLYQKAIQQGDVRAAEFIAKIKGDLEDKISIDLPAFNDNRSEEEILGIMKERMKLHRGKE